MQNFNFVHYNHLFTLREHAKNMNTKEHIIQTALEGLRQYTNIQGIWKGNGMQNSKETMPGLDILDGILEMNIDGKKVSLHAEVKKEIRNHQLIPLYELARQHSAQSKGPVIVIAERIFPKIKEELRRHHIAYLEANGNVYLQYQGIFLLVDGNKSFKEKERSVDRAYPTMDVARRTFTKTGLKVVFHFLLHPDWVNKPYREIAQLAGVALGNINYIIHGLQELGFLVRKDKDTYLLTRKKELLEKWMTAYEDKLKPTLKVGSFRFVKEEDFANWKTLPIRQEQTCWGAEAAGDLLTDYLRSDELTLYTTESSNELIKNYRIVPDTQGPITVYEKFWYNEAALTAPPLLVYADLMSKPDKRSLETAEKVYDKFLREQL